ncbi:TRAP transporter substrate-binding protein DctP (plasmid) [Tistrella bauzanensis]|uniref:TRAP transporter substrate-binding protein DctP n=1 Tax=Tistrella arctica TaxID=3133430 RepID=A0ABU9YLL5_9PROT
MTSAFYVRAILPTAIAVTTVAMAASITVASAQTTLRYTDYSPNRGIRAEIVEDFLKRIETGSDGRIKIERYWAQSLLPGTKTLEGLRNGVASFGTITADYTPNDLFAYRVGDLPVDNPHEVAGALALYDLATTNPVLQAEFDRLGVVYVANYSLGPIQMMCNNVDIVSADDFAGKKVRAVGNWSQIYAALGAVPAMVPLSEAYQALGSGMIDCSQAYGYIAEAYKLYEVGTSFTVIDGGTIQANGMFFGKRDFQRLTPGDQEMILRLGRELTGEIAAATRARNQDVIARMETGIDGHVITVHRFNDADRARIDQASQPFLDAFVKDAAARGIDGAALLADYRARLAAHLEALQR